MHGEGEHDHGGEHRGKVFLAVAKIVLEVITVTFQVVKALGRDLSSRSGTSGDFGDVLRVDIKRGREVAAAGQQGLSGSRVSSVSRFFTASDGTFTTLVLTQSCPIRGDRSVR